MRRLLSLLMLGAVGFCNAASTGMLRIPAGTFVPPFRSANGAREIAVGSFYLDIYPVTNQQFLEFVRANPRWRRSTVKPSLADTNYLKLWAGDLELGRTAPTNAPVTYISWYAARAYALWKDMRLPNTAEWEYAASASLTRPDGNNDPDFRPELLAWYAKPAPKVLPEVGAGRPNYFGLYDLHGLVWEWVVDFDTAAMMAGDTRGDAARQSEAFCGGASANATDPGNYPAFMRFAFRTSLKRHYTVHNLGFRCARDYVTNHP